MRIVSPHSSASDNDNAIPHGSFLPPHSFTGSLPQESESVETSEDTSPVDPFSMESDDGDVTTEDEDLRKNTMGNAGQRSTSHTTSKMPPDPSQKALANYALGTSTTNTDERSEHGTFNASAGVTKPHYDVDDFKRLLLTGERSVADSSAPSTPSIHGHGTQNMGDSSSNTDASSISRHSIFEPLPGASQDTPRTSHEVSPSGDERKLPLQPSPRTERARPPAPRPRHDNPTVLTFPQTVSFQDPMLSIQPSSSSERTNPGRSTPSSPRNPTDLNKPLPLPPAVGSLGNEAQALAEFNRRWSQSELFEFRGPLSSSPPSKKEPPAPPLARRHSQLRPKSYLGPSGRPTRILEENLLDFKPQPHQRTAAADSKPPPTPPPRRSGLTRSLSTASNSSSISALRAPSMSSNTDDESTSISKSPPPVPPTRTPSISSVKRPPRKSPLPNSTPPTAPPVPPRRRASSQTSQNSQAQSKLSGEYRLDQYRGDSEASSIPPVVATPSEPDVDDKDVLADLTALQREVDELRGKLK